MTSETARRSSNPSESALLATAAQEPSSPGQAADRLAGEFGAALDVVLDLIVPPRPARRLPGASEVEVLDYLKREAPQVIGEIVGAFERLDAEAESVHGQRFAALAGDHQRALVETLRAAEPGFMQPLALEAVSAYYVDPRVLAALGVEDRPPYPNGFQVIAGDLTLLAPVRKRGKIYRDA